MDRVPVGKQVTKTLRFRGPPYPTFTVAPQWDITNDNSVVVLAGTSIVSVSNPNGWDVTFTIPNNYQSVTDNDTLTLELYGTDSSGAIRSVDSSFSLLDAADDFLPTLVLTRDKTPILDSIILDTPDVTAANIAVTINDYLDNVLMKKVQPVISKIFRVANNSDVPDRFTEHTFRGYRYDLTIPAMIFPKLTRAPYQLFYEITTPIQHTEVHPVLRLNGRWFDFISSLKIFLDKARLIEIDPTLQWRQDELANSVMEGINYINSQPTVFTFWTVDDIPLPMKSIVLYAGALHALNTRYLAEGFNAFEFNGLSTSLNMDRRDTITYKIEELKAYLETNLTNVKSNAIATFGKGTPDPTVTNSNKEARSLTMVQNSPVRNVYGPAFGYQSGQYSQLY